MEIEFYFYAMKFLLLLCSTILFSSCYYQGYFQSPFHAVTHSYKTVPMGSEQKKNSQYAGGGFFTGGTNYQLRDLVNGAWGQYYSSFQPSENIQMYMGANGLLGSYRINTFDTGFSGVNLDVDFINRNAGTKFFTGLGACGGFYFVLPFAKNSEWRILELETSLMHEFGSYKTFRKTLPIGAASIIDRSSNFGSVSFGTEIVSKLKEGNISYKTNVSIKLGRLDYYNSSNIPPASVWPSVFSQTLQLSKEQLSFSASLNIGYKTLTGQFGLNYRLH